MDFLKAVNIIGKDMEEAMALLEQLSGVSGPEMAEIELAKARIRSASELLKLLPGLTGAKEGNPPVTAAQPAANPEPAHTPERITAQVTQPAPIPDPVPVSKSQPEPVGERPPRHQAGSQKSQEPSKAILADRFSPSGTLGDTISPVRQDEAITTAINSKPISDIGAVIGINDRFYFIRELFSGDALAYSDTIRRLNASASLGEAMRILDDSTVMGSDPAAQSSFVDVVRRKFSLNV